MGWGWGPPACDEDVAQHDERAVQRVQPHLHLPAPPGRGGAEGDALHVAQVHGPVGQPVAVADVAHIQAAALGAGQDISSLPMGMCQLQGCLPWAGLASVMSINELGGFE